MLHKSVSQKTHRKLLIPPPAWHLGAMIRTAYHCTSMGAKTQMQLRMPPSRWPGFRCAMRPAFRAYRCAIRRSAPGYARHVGAGPSPAPAGAHTPGAPGGSTRRRSATPGDRTIPSLPVYVRCPLKENSVPPLPPGEGARGGGHGACAVTVFSRFSKKTLASTLQNLYSK